MIYVNECMHSIYREWKAFGNQAVNDNETILGLTLNYQSFFLLISYTHFYSLKFYFSSLLQQITHLTWVVKNLKHYLLH